jgi:two-component system, cell cycle sensor histidine kinase and response regulator CckA
MISDAMPDPIRATEAARMQITQLVPGIDLSLLDIIRKSNEIVCETLRLDRSSIWMYVENRSAMRCSDLFEVSKKEHTQGARLWVDDFPRYFESLENRKTIPAELAQTDRRTSELTEAYLIPLGINSMLDAPILIGGQVVGVVCAEHVGPPREWTTEERDFVGSVADILALKIRSSELREVKSALKSQEERISSLEKAEALGQMATGVAHDFNNLLTVIHGNACLLQFHRDLPKDVRSQIDAIAEAGERGIEMVRELLQFGKREQSQPVSMDPILCIQEFLPVLQASVGKSHTILFSTRTASGKILIDRNRFTRIILNLSINARDAMPNGGEIQIEVASANLEENSGDGLTRYITVTVRDSGIGMDQATLKRIFEPYFTTKVQGTGIGMAIVKKFIEEVGGFVRIESTPGSGTMVMLCFPRISGAS